MVEAKLPPVAWLSSEAVAKVQALEEKLGHVVHGGFGRRIGEHPG